MSNYILLILCLVCPHFSSSEQAQAGAAPQTKYAPVTEYDPNRVAEDDIRRAVSEAARTGKRILLEVGGEWCGCCHIMDAFFEKNPGLLEFREQKFITVKINYSQENENKRALSSYPAISGYPHIFVLDSDGRLLHSQDTGELESGKSYDLEKFFSFLRKWAAPS